MTPEAWREWLRLNGFVHAGASTHTDYWERAWSHESGHHYVTLRIGVDAVFADGESDLILCACGTDGPVIGLGRGDDEDIWRFMGFFSKREARLNERLTHAR